MKKIGILGGTFDPPHIGHLVIAEEARLTLDLEEVWFIPSNIQVHKSQAATKGKDRLEMVKRAIGGNPYFKVNAIELMEERKSFTIDTMRQLKQIYPHYQFYFIIGADMVEYLPKWKNIDELIELVKFVGLGRSGYSLESPYPLISIDIPKIDISSSQLRGRMEKKISCRYFIPDAVYEYIEENKLYGH